MNHPATKKKVHHMTPPTLISVINQSKRVTDADAQKMTAAVGKQLAEHVAPLYGLVPALEFVKAGGKPTAGGCPCYLIDEPDVDGALGYHDEDGHGVAYIKVFVNPTLDNGGTVMTTGNSVSVTLSHEALELTGDAPANKWADGPNGNDFAFELCMAGDTTVRLANGQDVPIHVLSERGGFFDVRATTRAGCAVGARAGNARRTAMSAATIIVRMTDGSHFRCTPDHKILMADGSFRPARALRAGDRLLRDDGSPALTVPDAVDRREVHAEAPREPRSAIAAGQDFEHVGLGQLGAPVSLTLEAGAARHSALGAGIKHVLAVAPREEMSRPHAGGRVAGVADRQTTGDRSSLHLVGDAMGEVHPTLVSNLAIAGGVGSASPQPAAPSLSHARPEAFGERGPSPVVCGDARIEATTTSEPCPMRRAEALRSDGPHAAGHLAAHAKIVDAVEPGGEVDVYDLTVPGLRNFAIGAGVYVHNCDAVESDSYLVDGVAVSNFVLQAFFDAHAETGSKFDFLGKLRAPFSMSRGGYQITRTEPGKTSQIFAAAAHEVAGLHVHFGPAFPEWKKAAKLAKAAAKRGRR